VKNPPIFILGAGPAGLAAAYILTQQGQSVVVIEKDETVGGLARSIKYKDFILDYGPHRFFTKIPPVLKLWDEVLGADQVTVQRLTRIYYGRRYFRYPLKASEALSSLGLLESGKIIVSYLAAKLFPNRQPQNFSEWVTAKFGKRLFEIFFEAYTEKLWGLPCKEISADWAAQRIKGLSLSKAIRNALLGNDGKVKTLIDQFQFPRLGSGQLYEKISDHLKQQGQTVLLNTEVVQVHHQNGQVQQVTLKDGKTGKVSTVSCGGVISSIPITFFLQNLVSSPPESVLTASKSLKFRNTILVYLIVEGQQLFPDNWLYINEPSVQLGRVTNFSNWSPEMLPNQHQTPLCCEYWCNFGDAMWEQSESELLHMAEQELRKINLLHGERISSGFVVRLPQTYPIYAGQYKKALLDIQDYIKQFSNLQLIGRYGSFKYNNQDHSLLMGILAAENILTPGQHDLWAVNADSEYEEEASAEVASTAAKTAGVSRRRQVIQTVRQMGAYWLTGSAATILDVLMFSLLIESGMWYVFALNISYLLGLTINFLLSRQFVFKVYWKNWLIQYAVFTTVALNSLLANLGLMQILVNDLHWNTIAARLVSAGCVALLSFVGHKLYSFSPSEHPTKPIEKY
jgi:protoporphyrinogen oxidase/putative flippase GtrA